MKLYIVFCHDRHVDPDITVYETREGADAAIENFKKSYAGQELEWTEENYGRDSGWVRYVASGGGDGPNARIQETELKR